MVDGPELGLALDRVLFWSKEIGVSSESVTRPVCCL